MRFKTVEQVRARVVELVAHYNGLKPLDVVCLLDGEERSLFSGALLEQMILSGELMEVEYTLPNNSEYTCSLLLPMDTTMTVRYVVEAPVPEAQSVSIH